MQRAGFSKAAPITPSDTETLNVGFTVKAIWVGSTSPSALVVQTRQGGIPTGPGQLVTSTFPTGIIGQLIPISPERVLVASAATSLVALGD